jgi:tRNA (uracil-5-)-methyltransferase TRM9
VYNVIATEFDHTRHSVWQSVRAFLDRQDKYSVIADVGCGNGKNAAYRRDLVVIGNDVSTELLQIAHEKHSRKMCDFLTCNGLRLPYGDASFDAVMSIAVVHHVADSQARIDFISELIRIVKPGGSILVSVWAMEQNLKPKWRRVHPDQTDYMIPWTSKDGTIVDRFYHLYPESEVIDLKEMLTTMSQDCYDIQYHYERDNWFITITKR